ncbi:hypothetical protein [Nocardia sp. IFM 10818]
MLEEQNRSVLDQMRGFSWSSEESVAYEAAIEAVNKAVGAYSALLAALETAESPDPAAIADALSAQQRLARVREQLDPTDHDQIAATRGR